MQWTDLFVALSLVMVIEGIMPFISPAKYKEFLLNLQNLDDAAVRKMGLIMMIVGVISVCLLKA